MFLNRDENHFLHWVSLEDSLLKLLQNNSVKLAMSEKSEEP